MAPSPATDVSEDVLVASNLFDLRTQHVTPLDPDQSLKLLQLHLDLEASSGTSELASYLSRVRGKEGEATHGDLQLSV